MANHADKRSVSTDALETLGTAPLNENEARDAIHLAVEPVIAAERLFAGQDVGLVNGQASTKAAKMLGIVDPFLKNPIQPGQRFWLVVYPRQIKSLRHVWEHPDFPSALVEPAPAQEDPVKAAVHWIKEFASKLGYEYDDLMEAAENYYLDGSYEYDNSEGYKDFWAEFPTFWDMWSIVTGKPRPKYGDSFFTCSC